MIVHLVQATMRPAAASIDSRLPRRLQPERRRWPIQVIIPKLKCPKSIESNDLARQGFRDLVARSLVPLDEVGRLDRNHYAIITVPLASLRHHTSTMVFSVTALYVRLDDFDF